MAGGGIVTTPSMLPSRWPSALGHIQFGEGRPPGW